MTGTWRCLGCGFESIYGFACCPACMSPDAHVEHDPGRNMAPLVYELAEESDPETLADVAPLVPMMVPTWTALDVLGGYGVPYGVTLLLHGPPGSGKSRLCLCAANNWASLDGHRAGYVMTESMSLRDLRMAADQHHLTALHKIHLGHGILDAPSPSEPTLFVVDSLSDLARLDQQVQEAKDCQTFVREARDHSVVLIAHENKEGQYTGLTDVAHEVGAVARLFYDLSTQRRVLFVTKNRYGPTGIVPVPWPPYPHGWRFHYAGTRTAESRPGQSNDVSHDAEPDRRCS